MAEMTVVLWAVMKAVMVLMRVLMMDAIIVLMVVMVNGKEILDDC